VPRGWWLLVCALLTAGVACAGGGAEEEAGVEPAGEPVRVEVTNNFSLPMEIYAINSGTTHRMGTVHPGMSGRFTLPPTLISSGGAVEFQAMPSAEDRTRVFRSDELLLSPGKVVDFRITPQLFNSTVQVRP
jgi:hypothetical protein